MAVTDIFRSKSPELLAAYERKKHLPVFAQPIPASSICNHCWYQVQCIPRTLMRAAPKTCCVYELYHTSNAKSFTLEQVVEHTCKSRCVQRQQWAADPCPHDEKYCDSHCPVSKSILELPASDPNTLDVEGL